MRYVRHWVAGLALGFVAGIQALAATAPDIFERDKAAGERPGLSRYMVDLLLGRPRAAETLERELALPRQPGTAQERLDAYLQLCGAYFREQKFDRGLAACTAADRLKAGSAGNMIALHRAFVSAGPSRWNRTDVRIPLQDGQTAFVERNGVKLPAIIDTGAEIAVVSAQAAKQLGARKLGTSLAVGTTTAPIDGGLVQIDSLVIGNAVLYNLTAVVLSDQQAVYSGLSLAIPLSALTVHRRLAYTGHGTALLLGDAAPLLGENRTPLYWDESGVGFAAGFGRGVRGVHLDSGSKRTWLFPAARPVLSEAELATREAHRRTIGGLGGERVEEAALYRNVIIAVGRRNWRFPQIEMGADDENGESARVGTGLFLEFGTIILDFESMQMSAD